MQLSKNFTLNELIKTQTAVRNGIDNTPGQQELDNLKILVEKVLQPIRDSFGRAVIVSSGYRSPSINSLVGGSPNSDHVRGMAADIEIPGIDNKVLAEWIVENLQFTQLILEFYQDGDSDSGWVHVAYDKRKLFNQVMRARKGPNGRTLYSTGLN